MEIASRRAIEDLPKQSERKIKRLISAAATGALIRDHGGSLDSIIFDHDFAVAVWVFRSPAVGLGAHHADGKRDVIRGNIGVDLAASTCCSGAVEGCDVAGGAFAVDFAAGPT